MKVCVLTSETFGNKQVSEPPGQVQSYFSIGQVMGTLIIKQFTSELSHLVSIIQVIQVITVDFKIFHGASTSRAVL